MANLVIPSEEKSLRDLILAYSDASDEGSVSAMEAATRALNSHLATATSTSSPIVLPETADEICRLGPIGAQASQLAFAPIEQRKVLEESYDIVGGEKLAALAELLQDHGLYGATGDLNTFSSASLGLAVERGTKFHDAIRRVDHALRAFSEASSAAEKTIARGRVLEAYRTLHLDFQRELDSYIARNGRYSKKRGHPLLHPRRGMNMAASGSRQLPLARQPRLEPVRKLIERGSVIGRGMVVVDLGMRAHNVHSTYQAHGNWNRALVGEAFGLGFSMMGAYMVGLALLPFGWVVVLIAVGLAAVAGDMIGKQFGYFSYDRTRAHFGGRSFR